MTLARLFSPCILGHGDTHHDRNAAGAMIRRCDRCHADLGPILAGEMITTPLIQSVAGVPTGAVRRQVKAGTKVIGGRFT